MKNAPKYVIEKETRNKKTEIICACEKYTQANMILNCIKSQKIKNADSFQIIYRPHP